MHFLLAQGKTHKRSLNPIILHCFQLPLGFDFDSRKKAGTIVGLRLRESIAFVCMKSEGITRTKSSVELLSLTNWIQDIELISHGLVLRLKTITKSYASVRI